MASSALLFNVQYLPLSDPWTNGGDLAPSCFMLCRGQQALTGTSLPAAFCDISLLLPRPPCPWSREALSVEEAPARLVGLSRQVGTPASLSIGVLGLRCREPLQKVLGPRVFRPSSISDSEDCPLHTHRVSPVSRQAPGGHRTPTLRDWSFCPPCLVAGCHSPGT